MDSSNKITIDINDKISWTGSYSIALNVDPVCTVKYDNQIAYAQFTSSDNVTERYKVGYGT